MKSKKLSAAPMFFVMGVTALFVCGAVYYYMQSPHFPPTDSRPEEKMQVPVATPPQQEKTLEKKEEPQPVAFQSLTEFYAKRMEKRDLTLQGKSPESLKFKEVGKVKTACVEDEGPCGWNIFILTKEAFTSGNHTFYLAQQGGAGYDYFGPFTGDLKRLVAESKIINSLNP